MGRRGRSGGGSGALGGHLGRQRGVHHGAEGTGADRAARADGVVVGQGRHLGTGPHIVDGHEARHGGTACGARPGLAGGHRVVAVEGAAGRGAGIALVVAVLAVVLPLVVVFLVIVVVLLIVVLATETQFRLDIAEHALAVVQVHGASCFVSAATRSRPCSYKVSGTQGSVLP